MSQSREGEYTTNLKGGIKLSALASDHTNTFYTTKM